MKNAISITVLTVACTMLFAQSTYSQNPNREVRQQERAQANAQAEQNLSQLINSRTFMFQATEVTSTMNPMLQNIQLYQVWALWITPDQFRAMLPIYGVSSFSGQPTLLRKMNFTTQQYTFNVQQGDLGGLNVTMTAQDTWSTNSYTFFLQTTATGTNSTLTVSSPFQPSVTFMGNVQGSSITGSN